VADYILLGMYNLLRIRDEKGLRDAFRLVLQIHDALVLEVKVPYIGRVRDEIIPAAMTDGIPIMPRTLDGEKFSDLKQGDRLYLPESAAYRFKFDSSVFLNWGQPIEPGRGRALGIPEEYIGVD
jgi:hypothetical protein